MPDFICRYNGQRSVDVTFSIFQDWILNHKHYLSKSGWDRGVGDSSKTFLGLSVVTDWFKQELRTQVTYGYDVDGNGYIDMINSLCAVTLGYNDHDVNAAVKAQLEEGVTFSLSHPVEVQVAEKIVEMVPCAEKVRFGKNGSDATTGAIRVSRAFNSFCLLRSR